MLELRMTFDIEDRPFMANGVAAPLNQCCLSGREAIKRASQGKPMAKFSWALGPDTYRQTHTSKGSLKATSNIKFQRSQKSGVRSCRSKKQPTDLRRSPRDLGDGALVRITFYLHFFATGHTILGQPQAILQIET